MMEKTTVAQPAPAGDNGRAIYLVAEGVDRINGKKVTSQIVELTPAEALYDLALGRLIDPEAAEEESTDPEVSSDGGN